MISLGVFLDHHDPRRIMVQIAGPLQNRRGLNAVLGQRLADELTDHFRGKNREPNKRGWKKTGFWADLAGATAVSSITDDAAVVSVADVRYRIQLYGGTIKPTGGRKFLTIPLVEAANGLSVASYERKTGRELFRIGHAKVLFEKRSRGGDSSLTAAATGRRYRKGTATELPLAARQQLRAVYALATQATIKADPTAFPDQAKLLQALNEEAADFLARELTKPSKR